MHLIVVTKNLPEWQNNSNSNFSHFGAGALPGGGQCAVMAKSSNKIRDLRKDRGMTLEQLAEAVDVSVTYLQRIETGARRLKSDSMVAIARALDVSLNELLSDAPKAPKAKAVPEARIMIVGEAAAGVWREANADAFEPEPVAVAYDGRFPASALFVLRIRGTSINRQAPDGSLILCLDMFQAPREPGPGDWVVARRSRNGFAEMTVKQLRRLESGEVALFPDSTDPHHQEPILIGEHDGDEVAVVAYVLDFIRQATKL